MRSNICMDFPDNASSIASTKDRLQLRIRPCRVKGSTRAMLETARCALVRSSAPWCGRQVGRVRAASVRPSSEAGLLAVGVGLASAEA